MTNTPFDPDNFFGFPLSDVTKATAEEKAAAIQRKKEQSQICACGHAARHHTSHSDSDIHQALALSGRFSCMPGRMVCPCQEVVPVAETSDTRNFMHKTTGAGERHAFSKGVAQAIGKGGTVAWLPSAACKMCGTVEGLQPVSLTSSGHELDRPGPMNVLLCGDCRTKLRGTH